MWKLPRSFRPRWRSSTLPLIASCFEMLCFIQFTCLRYFFYIYTLIIQMHLNHETPEKWLYSIHWHIYIYIYIYIYICHGDFTFLRLAGGSVTWFECSNPPKKTGAIKKGKSIFPIWRSCLHTLIIFSWWSKWFLGTFTLPETSIAPKNGGFPIGISFYFGVYFQGLC